MNPRVRLKKWGKSLGAIIPKKVVKQAGLKEGEEVEISVRPVSDIKRLFGRYHTGISTQRIKNDMKAGWQDDDDVNH